MVQPSYPHTLELKHSRPHSKAEFVREGDPEPLENNAVPGIAPSDAAPIDSHFNDDNGRQAEQEGKEAVTPDSTIRKEVKPGPGEPH